MAGAKNNALRIMLVGRMESGKSVTANTILGEQVFDSKIPAQFITKSCQETSQKWKGRDLLIIDSPGLFYTKESQNAILNEIKEYLFTSHHGLHAIILVIQLGCYTQEEQQTMALIKNLFGEAAMKYMIILVTHKEDKSPRDYVRELKKLQSLIKECGDRYCVFSNRTDQAEKEARVQELVELIDKMVQDNQGAYFTNPAHKGTELTRPHCTANVQYETLRIVLVGKTGSGKSATANTLLGEKVFESKIAAEAVTKTCQKASRKWEGRELLVVDTPGLYDTKESLNTTCREIGQCVLASCPGPHAIVLVLRLGRYTQEEQQTVALVKGLFGEAAMKYMIILFTYKEELEDLSLSDFLEKADVNLRSLIKECGERCCAISNSKNTDQAEKEAQVQELVELIDKMVQDNQGAYFTNPALKGTELTRPHCTANVQYETLRIVLVGKTGSGKSATANTLLGEKVFESKIAAEAVTKTCQKASRKWKGRELLVVDTPGLFDTKESLNMTCREIGQCVLASCPGPHAIVLVLRLGRYTQEEQQTVALVKGLFGEAAMKYMIILFTYKEELEDLSLSDFLEKADVNLRSLIKECGERCCAISNSKNTDQAEKEAQVQELVELIDKMVQDNQGAYFTNPALKGTELTRPHCTANVQYETLRIVLVGKTGSGKSATANTLLGEKVFESKIAAEAVTKTCQKASRKWKGRELLVVDTPGLFDTKESLNTTCREICRCVLASCPGPHAIVLVLRLGRYTPEEQQTVALVKALFGETVMKYMIILFTRKEELEDQSLSDFLEKADVNLRSLIKECGERCCAISNSKNTDQAENESQVQELVELIENMVQINQGTYFSDAIYKNTVERLRRQEEVLKEIYYDQLKSDIQKVEMECAQACENRMQEKERKIKLLKMEYEKKLRHAREEARNSIFRDKQDGNMKFPSRISNWFKK